MKLCHYQDLEQDDPDIAVWSLCNARIVDTVGNYPAARTQTAFISGVFWIIRSGPFEDGHQLLPAYFFSQPESGAL